MEIRRLANGYEIYRNNQLLMVDTVEQPMIFVGKGRESIEMYRGNFTIEDYMIERVACVPEIIDDHKIRFRANHEGYIDMLLIEESNRLYIDFEQHMKDINRFFIRMYAEEEETVYGCGEQFSYFNLRGKSFPLWTREPGVGRDKSTFITFRADTELQGGGDYHMTYYPEATYVSSRKIYCHTESTAYANYNFENVNFHELEFFEVPSRMVIIQEDSFLNLMESLTAYTGRMVPLPEWVRVGAIVGLQGGTKITWEKLEKTIDNGIPVSGVWCQDWEGINETSFGKRLYWNWQWNSELYPELDTNIKKLNDKGIKYLGYINPYVVQTGTLYKEAKENNYLVLSQDREILDIDFGEFYCGIVDLTFEPAFQWYKNVIIKNMIDFGLSGWMADFGEYLPVDCILQSGKNPNLMHNEWPALWAKCNYEAVRDSGKLGEIVFFMRAGAFGSQKYNTLMWGGDQSVDWSRHDGIKTVIPSALSSGIIGNPFHHSDVGGYTSLFDNCRTKELFMRWAEMTVFSSVMRTHESNRPDTNFQYYNDVEAMKHFADMIKMHIRLKPYIDVLIEEASSKGIPLQRPLFMHYEEDEVAYDLQSEYLFGPDLLIAPIMEPERDTWQVHLPADTWVHLWSGKEFVEGDYEVEAPMGQMPIFYRKESSYAELFRTLAINA